MSFLNTIDVHSIEDRKPPSLQDLKEAFKRCVPHSKYSCKLILPLKTLSTSLATTLYLNIYEVNIIAKSYVLLWKTCETNPYLNVELLCQSYPKRYHNILQSFFYDSRVYWDEYFLFICCFLFCDIYQITNILLSICRIHSNLLISREQIKKFYILMSLSPSNFGDVDMIYNSLNNVIYNLTIVNDINNNNQQQQEQEQQQLPIQKQPKIYSIKNFIEYMNNSTQYQQIIINFRQNIIMSTLSLRIYKNIKLRQEFYDNNGGSIKAIPPPEPLFSVIYRRLFTHEPPPFYYDFGLQVKKGNELNQVVNGIRHMFGYSERNRKCVSLPNCFIQKKCYEMNNNNNNNSNNNKIEGGEEKEENNNSNNNSEDDKKEMKRSFLFRRKVKSCLLLNSVISNNSNGSNDENEKNKKIDVLKITDKSYFHKKNISIFRHSKIAPLEEENDP